MHLFRTRRLKANSVTVYLAALRFVFVCVLKRQWPVADTPYPKKPETLPVVLRQEEAQIAAAQVVRDQQTTAAQSKRRRRSGPRLPAAVRKEISCFSRPSYGQNRYN